VAKSPSQPLLIKVTGERVPSGNTTWPCPYRLGLRDFNAGNRDRQHVTRWLENLVGRGCKVVYYNNQPQSPYAVVVFPTEKTCKDVWSGADYIKGPLLLRNATSETAIEGKITIVKDIPRPPRGRLASKTIPPWQLLRLMGYARLPGPMA
jgi:hypothetical protein